MCRPMAAAPYLFQMSPRCHPHSRKLVWCGRARLHPWPAGSPCCGAAVLGADPALQLRSPSREHCAVHRPRALFPGQMLCPPVFPGYGHGPQAEEEEGARLAGCCAVVAAWGAQLGPCRSGVLLWALRGCRMASHP